MHIRIQSILLFMSIFLSGCMQPEVLEKETVKIEEVDTLNKQVKKLEIIDKQKIYKSIQNEIQSYKEKGDKAYSFGYYADAIKSYEIVNFYEGKDVIVLKKMKKIAFSNAAKHYKKALKYKDKDKKKFIIQLNQVMINNPQYKDAKVLLNKAKIEMWQFFRVKEEALYQKVINDTGALKNLKKLRIATNDLRLYEYNNNTVIQADKKLQKFYKIFLNDAILHHKKARYTQAKKGFEDLLFLNKDDIKAKKYLRKMRLATKKKRNLEKAEEKLKNAQYKKSLHYAKKVLNIDNENAQAQMIVKKADKELKKKVHHFLSRGKQAYKHKNLDKAKENFEKVLNYEPTNKEALVYCSKITRQFNTINTLR